MFFRSFVDDHVPMWAKKAEKSRKRVLGISFTLHGGSCNWGFRVTSGGLSCSAFFSAAGL